MESTLNEVIAKAHAEARAALHELENIMEEAQDAHNLFLGQATTVKRALKSANHAILDAVDQIGGPPD